MWKKSLIWQIYPPYMSIIFLSLIIFTLYGSNLVRQFYLENITDSLQNQSILISQLYKKNLMDEQTDSIQVRLEALGKAIPSRITIILPSGVVIGDTHEEPEKMDNHADRPEIRQALNKQTGNSTRFSNTLGEELMYVAVPVVMHDSVIAVTRTATPVSKLALVLSNIYRRILLVGLVVGIAAALISWIFSERINRPVQTMQEGFRRYGSGDLTHRIHIKKPEEFRRLSESMNTMAENLSQHINIITRQRNELEAILSSMVEGVFVVDPDKKILRINDAAMKIIGIEDQKIDTIRGRGFHELVRNQSLQKFIERALETPSVLEAELTINDSTERSLNLHGTRLIGADRTSIGALVVVNDVTHLKKLENIRKEFVSNVSHELKTPITSIKGYVETLKDGAIKDKKNARRFLKIISKHTDRLNAIIEDLLNLSRIEQDANTDQIKLEYASVKRVFVEAVSVCYEKAGDRKIKIEIDCSNRIKTMMKPPLLTLAIVNLLDNAIKYSDENSKVHLSAFIKDDYVVLSVQDWGCGIPKKSRARIFERFYRVDKARSRDLGGTGLGLAIVKHIVQAHRGHIEVESPENAGTRFNIYLPLAEPLAEGNI